VAFEFSVKRRKVPNPRFEKQPQTCTFTERLTVRWVSLLMRIDHARLMTLYAQKEASSEKKTLSQSRSKSSRAQAIRFLTCFSDNRGFYMALKYFI
jgi:hypothetical protein